MRSNSFKAPTFCCPCSRRRPAVQKTATLAHCLQHPALDLPKHMEGVKKKNFQRMLPPNSLSVCQASEFSDRYYHYCNKTSGEVNARTVWNFKGVNKPRDEGATGRDLFTSPHVRLPQTSHKQQLNEREGEKWSRQAGTRVSCARARVAVTCSGEGGVG